MKQVCGGRAARLQQAQVSAAAPWHPGRHVLTRCHFKMAEEGCLGSIDSLGRKVICCKTIRWQREHGT